MWSSRERIENMLKAARAEIGYKEKGINITKYGAWFGLNGQPWCAMFVSWVGYKSGNADIIPQTASTWDGVNWFRSRGQWGKIPKSGAIAYFFFHKGVEHVAIVEKVDEEKKTITVIEGNANDNVERRTCSFFDKEIYGYGYPDY